MTDFNYAEYAEKQARLEDIECARTREWAYFIGAYLTGPIVPAWYYFRNKKAVPFLGGLALGVITLPFILLDAGIFSSLPAAGLATGLMHQEAKKSRRKVEALTAEQADVLKMKEFTSSF